MRHVTAILTIWLLAAALPSPAAEPVEAAVITSHPGAFQKAMDTFHERYGAGRLALILTGSDVSCATLQRAKAVYVEGGFWSAEMSACTDAVREMSGRGAAFSGTMAPLITANWRIPPSPRLAEASRYLSAGGPENLLAFLVLMHNAAGGTPAIPVPPVKPSASSGIYYPGAPAHFATLDEYLTWRKSANRGLADGPKVGILFFKSALNYGATAHIDALVAALERRGLVPVPAFGWPLKSAEPLLAPEGKATVELMLLVDPVMPSLENAQFLEKYRLHAMNLMTTSATEKQWRESESGLPPGRLAIQVINAEQSGVTEPILIAATAPQSEGGGLRPIAVQIELAAARARRWVDLRTKTNFEKTIALVYFNNPAGKATLGASYLDLIPSLHNVVARLSREGYRVNGAPPDEEKLKNLLLMSGRNVGEYAPGELDLLLKEGHVTLLPATRYEEWFRQLPEEFQRNVTRAWGAPRASRLMTVHSGDKTYFVIPGVRLGNLFLLPQPLRGELAQADANTHDRKTPPPHSYIAAYLWIQHQLKADAIVHFGRHGTLEWLPGKDVAQLESDPGSALIGDLPHAYYYLVDGGGEFLQAKRRSSAVMISHLTPLLASAGIPADYKALKESIENYERNRETAPVVAAEHAHQAWTEARRMKLDSQLKLTGDMDEPARMERLDAYLHEMEEQAIPLGLHGIGKPPSDDVVREAVTAYLLNAATPQTKAEVEKHAASWVASLMAGVAPEPTNDLSRNLLNDAREWLKRLRESPEAELQSLVDVLNGRFVASGVSGDPLRAPGALPTGRNLHDQDPRGFPSKAAWAAGERMAGELVRQYQQKHGHVPKRVSFVLWYGESGRTQGLQEAQALALLGVRPVWNGRGQVADVELIPPRELARPRVDVVLTMSGLYRDGMPEKLPLLDRAVRLVREAPEDNAVQAHTVAVENDLVASGVEPAKARQAARARIFGPQPGVFGVGMAGMMEFSRDAGDPEAAANLYLRNMNYAYGAGLNGEAIPGALKQQLKRNEVVVHGRSSNLYGLLDNDETYQFAGGLNAATKAASGRVPDFLIANARKAGSERYDEANHFVRRELATRLENEKWIEGMKSAGYAGAQQISKEIEHLYGFRATAPEQVDPEVWQQLLDTYIRDKRNLGLEKWFRESNPHARQMVAARLIEIDRQGVYQYSKEDKQALVAAYIKSVNESGVSCYANACGNRKLIRHVAQLAREVGATDSRDVQQYEVALQRATTPSARNVASDNSKRSPQVQSPGRSSLRDVFSGVRIFDAGPIQLRTPETTLGWIMLLLPVPFGIATGILRRRITQRSSVAFLSCLELESTRPGPPTDLSARQSDCVPLA